MSPPKFQSIARCLAAAGYAKHPGNESIDLSLDTKGSSLIRKHWTGNSISSQELVTQNVRPNSSAACLITPAHEYIICISSSSTFRILDHNDREGWVPKIIPRYEVHRKGKFVACTGVDGLLHLFFQDPLKRLIYLDVTRGNSAVLPASPVVGSPIFVDILDGKMYVFYISAGDHFIHYVVIRPDGRCHDSVMVKLWEAVEQFSVAQNPESGSSDVYVLTQKRALLYISGDGKRTVLGKVDAEGKFVSGRSVDRCCNDAWDGTLTVSSLKKYLESDPSIINSPGGDEYVTPLAGACCNGHDGIVKLLLEFGANPNALSPRGCTPLFYVTTRSPPQNRCLIVRALLLAGANIDECHAESGFNTPLMNAIAVISDKEVVHELLKRGASSTLRNSQGQSPEALAKGTEMQGEVLHPRRNEETGQQSQTIEFAATFVNFIDTFTNGQDFQGEVVKILNGLDGNSQGQTAKIVAQGTNLGQGLLAQQRDGEIDPGQAIQFVATFAIFIMLFTNSPEFLNEILRSLNGTTIGLGEVKPPVQQRREDTDSNQITEFVATFVVFIATHTKNQDVLDEIVRNMERMDGATKGKV